MVRMSFIVVATFSLVMPLSASGAFTDFQDLTFHDTYSLGESIESNGITFEVVEFTSADRSVAVGGTETNHSLGLRGMGLNFHLLSNTKLISLDYRSSDDGHGIVLNGVPSSLGVGFSHLDDSTIAGVSIFVDSHTFEGGEEGELTLQGPIDAFIVGGIELGVDNVRLLVPEPSTASTLLIVACSLLSVLGRRQSRGRNLAQM